MTRYYSLILTEDELRLFSEDLEDYIDFDNKKIKGMTENQIRMALEDERKKARRNTSKIVNKRAKEEGEKGKKEGGKKGKKRGTIAGGVLGGIGGTLAGRKKGAKGMIIGGLSGATGGALLGRLLGKGIGESNGETESRESSESENYVVFLGNSAHVKDCVSHTSERGVDANVCGVGNFLEAHVVIVSHHEHFALKFGKGLHEALYVVVNLVSYQLVLDGFLT